MPLESTKIAEFKLLKDQLIRALSAVSFAGKAVVALIINRQEENAVMGINFNNVANLGESTQFDVAAAYPIFNDEFLCRRYFVSVTEWPVFYIACMPEFINSVNTLPPIDSEALDMVFWSIREGNKQKSEAVIFGDHHAHTTSIIEHSDIIGESGEVLREVTALTDAETFRHYG